MLQSPPEENNANYSDSKESGDELERRHLTERSSNNFSFFDIPDKACSGKKIERPWEQDRSHNEDPGHDTGFVVNGISF